VPGDIVLLASGDKVPADLRLFETRNLRIEEAALTGESEPVEKSPNAVAADAPMGDRTSMAYSGTMVVFGLGKGVVVASGDATEIGRIGQMLGAVASVQTPLLKQMAQFGRWLTAGILALTAMTMAVGVLLHGQSAEAMFLAAVGLAVAAIPGGAASDHDHYTGHRRAAHGLSQRHHPAHAGGGDARCRHDDLFGQNGDADQERNDRTTVGDR